METKLCKKCGTEKSLSEFYKHTRNKDGLDYSCKKCMKDYSFGWRKRNPDKVRRTKRKSGLKDKYGISIEEYEDIFYEQGGVCAICKEKFNENLSVDHCHDTGKVRGLLCYSCNAGLGMLGDSTEGLQLAIDYLEKFKCGE